MCFNSLYLAFNICRAKTTSELLVLFANQKYILLLSLYWKNCFARESADVHMNA